MRERSSIEHYLRHTKAITDRLTAISAVGEEHQVVTLLGILLDNYATVVTALETHGNDVTL